MTLRGIVERRKRSVEASIAEPAAAPQLIKLKKVQATLVAGSPRANSSVHDDYIGDESLHSSLDNILSDKKKKKDLNKVASR